MVNHPICSIGLLLTWKSYRVTYSCMKPKMHCKCTDIWTMGIILQVPNRIILQVQNRQHNFTINWLNDSISFLILQNIYRAPLAVLTNQRCFKHGTPEEKSVLRERQDVSLAMGGDLVEWGDVPPQNHPSTQIFREVVLSDACESTNWVSLKKMSWRIFFLK